MAPYYPVTVARSDGVQRYFSASVEIHNAPQNQKETDLGDGKSSQYSAIPTDGSKVVIWKRKLGAALMDEILTPVEKARKEYQKEYILKDVPEGYVLWQHDQKGGNEGSRSDTYLYGHPGGRNKRYRSPQEFLPHLIWLSKDRTGDRSKCLCKHCKSMAKSSGKKPDEKIATTLDSLTKQQKLPEKNAAAPVAKTEVQLVPTATPSSIQQTIRTAEQTFDAQANGIFLYRPGELTWFSKNQTAWGLAVTSKRWIESSTAQYVLQPLSHPLQHPSPVIREQAAIRPYLAWSVPDTTNPSLKTFTYDQVDWDGVVAGRYGQIGDAEVDGSILAAKATDASYSFFFPIPVLGTLPTETFYNGMFLGAEKIWVGEPVRLKTLGTDPIVLIIQRIKERIDPTTLSSTVTIIGDVYTLVEMPTPAPYHNRANWPTPRDLPPRMIADLHFRNEVADNAKTSVWREWRLLDPMAKKSLQDIRGRWYETSSLMPILKGTDAFNEDMRLGVVADMGASLNGRGDSSGVGGVGLRKMDRMETLGRAVPHGFQISAGLDGPQEVQDSGHISGALEPLDSSHLYMM